MQEKLATQYLGYYKTLKQHEAKRRSSTFYDITRKRKVRLRVLRKTPSERETETEK